MNYYYLTKRCKETGHRVFIYEKMTTIERSKLIREGWRTV